MGENGNDGVIDLDQPSTVDQPRLAARLRRPWPRPLIAAATAVVAVLGTLLAIQLASPGYRQAAPPPSASARPADTSWATLYGAAVLKLRTSGRTVFDGINAVDSGYRLETRLSAGDYRLDFACASEVGGIALSVLVRGGEGDAASARAECDADHTDMVFHLDEEVAVSVWVGSYQVASTAYAFAVVPG